MDVKLEHLMLSPLLNSSSSSSIYKIITDHIRMIDFGFVDSYVDVTLRTSNKHRLDESEGGGGSSGNLAGTPLYASRDVLHGYTVSRRDELESVGYVIVN